MTRSASRRMRRSRQEQGEIVGRFESSGLEAKQFCRREGVALSNLQRWRRGVAVATRPGFVELLPPTPSATPSSRWSVELVLPNGACLRFRE